VLPTPFLDDPATPDDMAMSGLAFHPDFANNRKLYVITGEETSGSADYSAPQDDDSTAFDNVIFEYQSDAINPDVVDMTTKRELLRVHQAHRQHNLGDLAFDDRHLFISSGDGGRTRGGTPAHYNTTAAQTTNPLGAILRIDVDDTAGGPYGIPSDNPFAGGVGGNVPEIYAWGVRNPWRISADRVTGEIYTGVNGDFTIEQIIRVELGKNYGWDSKEGSFLWDPVTGDATVDPNPDPQLTAPTAEYDHNGTTQAFGSAIGGFVYRGSNMPERYGDYIFLDYVAGEMIAMDIGTGALELVPIDPGGEQLGERVEITWGEDEDGELYIGTALGQVLKLSQASMANESGRVPDGAGAPGGPLTIARAGGGEITLDWSSSCLSGDFDYSVYAGTIGDFTSHGIVLCTTAGTTDATILPTGSQYYLVVPHNGTNEGWYGTDGNGAPRPPAATACRTQLMAPCS
jgi:hypothetical protein